MSRLVALCLLRHVAAAPAWEQVGEDVDGEADSQFGFSLALSTDGQTLAVGGMTYDSGSIKGGHLRVLTNAGGAWSQVGADMVAKTPGEGFGYAVAMNAGGSRVIGGGKNANSNVGVARVYQYGVGVGWSQIGSDLVGEGSGNYYGESVAMSADGLIVAVGASRANSRAGRVQIFEQGQGQYVQKGSNIEGVAGSSFGHSVALSADGLTVAVGATRAEAYFGSVMVYSFVGGDWAQKGTSIVGGKVGDMPGRSVALSASGLRLAVGVAALENADDAENAGGVMVYDFDGGAWVQVGATIMGEGFADNLGTSVSLSDDGSRVACGGPYNLGDGTTSGRPGHGRVYELSDGAWVQAGQDVDGDAAGDAAGISVALSGDGFHFAIGASGNDGQARVFKIDPPASTAPPTPSPTVATTPPVFVDAAVSTLRLGSVCLLATSMAIFMA